MPEFLSLGRAAMVAAISDEFVVLCRTQISLLIHSLGATLSVVYLAEDWADETIANLRPIAAVPDSVMTWSAERLFTWLTGGRRDESSYPQALPPLSLNRNRRLPSATSAVSPLLDDDRPGRQATERLQQPSHQLILPIAQNSIVMGALVVARAEQPWSDDERHQAEDIAKTLAIACLLDQRSQWFSRELKQQRQLQRQQRDVLGDLLHQFRNPLTAMQTFGKLLLRKLLPDDRNHTAAAGIVRESVRLQELLEEFDRAIETPQSSLAADAELERIYPLLPSSEAAVAQEGPRSFLNGRDLCCQPYSITDILAPLLMTAAAIAQDCQIEFNVELADDLPQVWVDAKALREVLNNLLDNALKYTPSGGRVWVWVGDRQPMESALTTLPNHDLNAGSQQAIAIADDGPGIPTTDLTRIFERHYRGIQSQTDIPGTGLGLAIAQDLIQQMGGRIEVFSPLSTWTPALSTVPDLHPVTHGTVFVVWLPPVQSSAG